MALIMAFMLMRVVVCCEVCSYVGKVAVNGDYVECYDDYEVNGQGARAHCL